MNSDEQNEVPSGDLGQLLQELNNINIDAASASINETSISDNNGGRIELEGFDNNDSIVKK